MADRRKPDRLVHHPFVDHMDQPEPLGGGQERRRRHELPRRRDLEHPDQQSTAWAASRRDSRSAGRGRTKRFLSECRVDQPGAPQTVVLEKLSWRRSVTSVDATHTAWISPLSSSTETSWVKEHPLLIVAHHRLLLLDRLPAQHRRSASWIASSEDAGRTHWSLRPTIQSLVTPKNRSNSRLTS